MIRPRHLISGFSAVVVVWIGSGAPLLAKPLRVGVTGTPPFVTQTEAGFDGISIDVWRAVAEENKLNYELIPQESPDEGIEAVDRETIDLLIGPISITPRRLAVRTSISHSHTSSPKQGSWFRSVRQRCSAASRCFSAQP